MIAPYVVFEVSGDQRLEVSLGEPHRIVIIQEGGALCVELKPGEVKVLIDVLKMSLVGPLNPPF